MKGGKREGAGRPLGSTKPEAKPRAIRLTDAEYVKYVELGGARWVKRLLSEAVDEAIKAG
jgi:hypothetical protein